MKYIYFCLLIFVSCQGKDNANYTFSVNKSETSLVKVFTNKKKIIFTDTNYSLVIDSTSKTKEWVILVGTPLDAKEGRIEERYFLINTKYEKEIPYQVYLKKGLSPISFVGFEEINNITYINGFKVGSSKELLLPLNKTFEEYLISVGNK